MQNITINETIKELVIIYPNMRYDIESIFKIVSLWNVPYVKIYAIEDFDAQYMQKQQEPIGMPHGLEKLQTVLLQKLKKIATICEENPNSSDDLDYWILKFTVENAQTKQTKQTKSKKSNKEFQTTTFTLNYYYDIDPFGDFWPEMDDAHVLLHTNGPLDPEIVGELVENPYNINVYGTRDIFENIWKVHLNNIELIDDESDIYLYGSLGDHLTHDSSNDE